MTKIFIVFGLALVGYEARAEGSPGLEQMMAEIQALRAEVGRLVHRVDALEACRSGAGAPEVTPCVPIDQDIPIQASEAHFHFAHIVAGRFPNRADSVGNVSISGPVTGGPFQGSSVDGTISLHVEPTEAASTSQYGYSRSQYGYPWSQYEYHGSSGSPQTASIRGLLRIAPLTRADLINRFGEGACVSGVSLDLHQSYHRLFLGSVYLYLNRGNHGYILQF